MGDAAKLPDTGIWRVVDLKRAFTDLLKLFELQFARLREESIIEEGLRRAKNDVAVNIVLNCGRACSERVGQRRPPARARPPRRPRRPLLSRGLRRGASRGSVYRFSQTSRLKSFGDRPSGTGPAGTISLPLRPK